MKAATVLTAAAALLLAGQSAAQDAVDADFCASLQTAIVAASQPEPFASLRQDPTKAQGYTTLTLPGFERCYAGRMGASPPGVPTFVCRKREAPADFTRNSLAAKASACLGQEAQVDTYAALFFVVDPARVSVEEVGSAKRMVTFSVTVPPKPAE